MLVCRCDTSCRNEWLQVCVHSAVCQHHSRALEVGEKCDVNHRLEIWVFLLCFVGRVFLSLYLWNRALSFHMVLYSRRSCLSAVSPDETRLWKDSKTVQTCHRISGCLIPDEDCKKLPPDWHFWTRRCRISTSPSVPYSQFSSHTNLSCRRHSPQLSSSLGCQYFVQGILP